METEQSITSRFTSKGVFPYQYAFTLLIPLRNIFLSPKQLVKRLALKPDMTVLEVGPGPGYFSLVLARELKAGKLILADIQPQMLEMSKKRLQKRKYNHVEYHLCNGKTFSIENDSLDRIVMVAVIGEVENNDMYIREFHRMLRSDGVLSVSELAGDPDKISVEEIKQLLADNGFVESDFFGNRRNYTINFKKA